MSDKPVREYDKFMLRFPDGMRDAIAERAKRNGRSMNSEIVQILQDALDNEGKGILLLPDQPSVGEKYRDENSPEFKAALNLARVLMMEANEYLTGKKKKPT
ncbi:Arc family DNA-binding protein [Klebsiella pneumoniae]|uniref:Arc family DNA-binding protein n=1 Tax=Klebsiella pneumoniae TaxID=573 RepID=UPI001F1C61AA|nr:Arc family DNA-binding protein [Klebsiella pneumoniae]MDZ0061330.1 Arc family DNA-binding protein [Klebsiella pneumoniae]MDZ0116287.1 Arc family DNA-binding protein [Klebsiella pneumoniae]MDZ0126333.1 Arc family DNA-binding protein [Klebsiella pneumoniae]MDZ0138059.1 Arc family DNA-binding protein [Klebsiella pneumoniae]MDZ0148342.1 Arc family DNA-binding protein [Klebsiella pneumoniae]